MPHIDRIIGIFPEGGLAKPAPEVIAKIRAIDEAIRGTRTELEKILEDLEVANKVNWSLGNKLSWNHFDGTSLARFPEHNDDGYLYPEALAEIHRVRYEMIAPIFANQNVVIENDGVKSFARAKKKYDRRIATHKTAHIPDLTRMRLVVPGLASLEHFHDRLLSHMHEPLRQVGSFNYYTNAERKYPTPFRGLLTTWCGMNDENADDQIATEVQLVTERVRATMHIDHPFNVSQILKYPDEETKDDVYGLMLKASILDFQERFPA